MRTPRRSLLSRLLLAQLGVLLPTVVGAGLGVRYFAYRVIQQGDMMTKEKLPAFLQQTGYYLAGVTILTGVGAALLAWLLARRIVRPLGRINQVARAVARGEYDVRVAEPGKDELGELAQSIDQMTADLARVEGMRRNLVANVAHELRTPLTSSIGLLQAVRDGLLAPTPANLELVGDELARLRRLVDAIHQLSVSDSTTAQSLVREQMDLVQVTQAVLEGMAPLFEQKAISVRFKAPAANLVKADRDRVVQILVNLLENAQKYTPSGGHVGVEVQADGVLVENDGPGIDPADLPFVFDRFFRGDKARTGSEAGVGIGLALVKNLVEAHGGRISLSSRPDETRIFFSLSV